MTGLLYAETCGGVMHGTEHRTDFMHHLGGQQQNRHLQDPADAVHDQGRQGLALDYAP